jgi:hypothetical protein
LPAVDGWQRTAGNNLEERQPENIPACHPSTNSLQDRFSIKRFLGMVFRNVEQLYPDSQEATVSLSMLLFAVAGRQFDSESR